VCGVCVCVYGVCVCVVCVCGVCGEVFVWVCVGGGGGGCGGAGGGGGGGGEAKEIFKMLKAVAELIMSRTKAFVF